MSDHSWVHVQNVVNIALRLLRLLTPRAASSRRGARPRLRRPRTPRWSSRPRRCCTTPACRSTAPTTRPTACSSRRGKLDQLLEEIYEEPERRSSPPRRCTRSSATAAAATRSRSRPGSCAWRTRSTWSRAARGCRSRRSARTSTRCRRPRSTTSGSTPGEDRAIRIEIEMNNSAGIFQVDELLATKLRGSGLEDHVEVIGADRGRAREAARADLQDLTGECGLAVVVDAQPVAGRRELARLGLAAHPHPQLALVAHVRSRTHLRAEVYNAGTFGANGTASSVSQVLSVQRYRVIVCAHGSELPPA